MLAKQLIGESSVKGKGRSVYATSDGAEMRRAPLQRHAPSSIRIIPTKKIADHTKKRDFRKKNAPNHAFCPPVFRPAQAVLFLHLATA